MFSNVISAFLFGAAFGMLFAIVFLFLCKLVQDYTL